MCTCALYKRENLKQNKQKKEEAAQAAPSKMVCCSGHQHMGPLANFGVWGKGSARKGDRMTSCRDRLELAEVRQNLAPSAECRQGLLVLPLASSNCG